LERAHAICLNMAMIYLCCSAYNEAADLPSLLKKLSDYIESSPQPVHILIYNDGSTDATGSILQEAEAHLPISVLGGQENCGLGYGIAALMRHLAAHGEDEDVAVFMDADNSHDPSVISLFLQRMEAGADVVIASRFHAQSRMAGFPWHRRLLSFCASRYF